MSDLKDFALTLAIQQEAPPLYSRIVYETWRLKPNKAKSLIGSEMLSSQLVGMIRLTAWRSGAKLYGYGPDRKHVALGSMPDDLKARFKDSSEQHDQDALMHLWLYFFDEWFEPTEDPC